MALIDSSVCNLGKTKVQVCLFQSISKIWAASFVVPILLLGSLGIGKRCFESRSNSTFFKSVY